MEKHLVTIQFSYMDKPYNEHFSGNTSKTITIGVFETIDEAIEQGNKALEVLEANFDLNDAWNKKNRFSKTGGPYNWPKILVTNLAYLKTPFEFYAKITKLEHVDVQVTVDEVLKAIKRFQEFKQSLL